MISSAVDAAVIEIAKTQNALSSERHCPLCRESAIELMFELRARDFSEINWTYSKDYARILEIAEDSLHPIVACKSCGFLYAKQLPPRYFLERVYDSVIDADLALAASRTPASVARRMRYISTLSALLPDKADLTVLDYGCGFGTTSRLLAEFGFRVVAYDPSKVRQASIRDDYENVVIANSFDDMRQHGPYHAIILDNVLEHVPNPTDLAYELGRLCYPRAVLYVSVPSYEPAKIEALMRQYRSGHLKEMTLNPWEHLNYFRVTHLDMVLQKGGFAPLQSCDLPGPVDIGLRPERQIGRRIKNAVASASRLARYVIKCSPFETAEHRYFRLERLPASTFVARDREAQSVS